MDRNCDKCIHHTTGSCSKWTCEFKSVADVIKGNETGKAIMRQKGYEEGVIDVINDIAIHIRDMKNKKYISDSSEFKAGYEAALSELVEKTEYLKEEYVRP